MIDAQISKLEEHRERERNELLKRSEIPDGADQFSNFQLQRLLQRSKTNTQLKMVSLGKKLKKIIIVKRGQSAQHC